MEAQEWRGLDQGEEEECSGQGLAARGTAGRGPALPLPRAASLTACPAAWAFRGRPFRPSPCVCLPLSRGNLKPPRPPLLLAEQQGQGQGDLSPWQPPPRTRGSFCCWASRSGLLRVSSRWRVQNLRRCAFAVSTGASGGFLESGPVAQGPEGPCHAPVAPRGCLSRGCSQFFLSSWLHWVSVAGRGLSSSCAERSYFSLWCAGISSWRLLLESSWTGIVSPALAGRF